MIESYLIIVRLLKYNFLINKLYYRLDNFKEILNKATIEVIESYEDLDLL